MSGPAQFPFASVTICTFNRARWLRETLAFVTRQDYPADRWELIVVDNASGDDTRAVVESFSGAPKPPRYVFEATNGLSHARNRALAEARGEMVVFLDDDTDGAPDWLRQLATGFGQDPGQRIGIVGGEIIPRFPDGLPRWLKGQWEPLAYRADPGPLPAGQLPMGANFGTLLSAAREVGGFRTDLGRTSRKLSGSEDHDFIRRVRGAGYGVWYVPAAVVHHLIPGNRLRFRYAMRYAFDSSRSRVVERTGERSGNLGWLLSRLVANSAAALLYAAASLLALVVFPTGWSKRWLTRASRAAGYVVEAACVLGRRLRS